MPPPRKSNKTIIVAVIIIVAVLVVAAVAMTVMNASANVKSTSQEMVLKQSDFPSGWRTSGTTLELPDHPGVDWAYSVFNNSITRGATESFAEVSCQILTYNSVASAKADYSNMIQNESFQPVTEVSGHFDQCHLKAISVSTVVMKEYVFQKKNVCGVIVFSYVGGYQIDQAWIDQMLDLQESRIV
ncbi:MAG: hypothetical protein SA339_12405 [Methanomassiliicoccus sp.]|nr:hypothetical protein [Methanomassiliicoccus sp.]